MHGYEVHEVFYLPKFYIRSALYIYKRPSLFPAFTVTKSTDFFLTLLLFQYLSVVFCLI